MMVLAGEVYYYKKKTKQEEEMKKIPKFSHKIQPLDNFDYQEKLPRDSILLGASDTFKPVSKKDDMKPRLSIISINPRD